MNAMNPLDTETEKILKSILRDNTLLTITPEDIHDDIDLIDDLALDSILIVNLFADLEKEFAIKIDLTQLPRSALGKYADFKKFFAGLRRSPSGGESS